MKLKTLNNFNKLRNMPSLTLNVISVNVMDLDDELVI